VRWLEPNAPAAPLGLQDAPGLEPVPEVHIWAPGDRLLLYTDGLLEARDPAGHFLPAQAWTATLTRPGLGEALDALTRAVLAHVHGRLDDDLALLLAEHDG
jgi:serine phosphatase RsbU (regulator of sigma subunit)